MFVYREVRRVGPLESEFSALHARFMPPRQLLGLAAGLLLAALLVLLLRDVIAMLLAGVLTLLAAMCVWVAGRTWWSKRRRQGHPPPF